MLILYLVSVVFMVSLFFVNANISSLIRVRDGRLFLRWFSTARNCVAKFLIGVYGSPKRVYGMYQPLVPVERGRPYHRAIAKLRSSTINNNENKTTMANEEELLDDNMLPVKHPVHLFKSKPVSRRIGRGESRFRETVG